MNTKIKSVVLSVAIPCILGILFLKYDLADLFKKNAVPPRSTQKMYPSSTTTISVKCKQHFRQIFNAENEDPFQKISLVVHKHGEATSCGETDSESTFYAELLKNFALHFDNNCPPLISKYQVESLMTKTFSQLISSCFTSGQEANGLLGFCDAGPEKTPILLDHNKLIPVKSSIKESSLPCRFHTREGLRISDLKQLTKMAKTAPPQCEMVEDAENAQTCKVIEDDSIPSEIHLYAVPAGRVFMFAPSYVGEIFHLPHVQGADDIPIFLKVLSLQPRVFDVFNFFSRDESQDLVDTAVAQTSESHRIKRSSTGATGYNVNSRRTSESGFDTHGKTATKVKKRCFSALGFDQYLESHGDGLQILRYNVTTAYNSHLDWIADNAQLEHDYQSAGTGGNRFATILLYMTDIGAEDGGETVFPKGWPYDVAESDRVNKNVALTALRESERGDVLKRGSWEEDLVATCRSRLSIRPHSSRAVLFYSQLPDGTADPFSLHAACPVLNGIKYAANLWVWNTPRQGFSGSPIKEKFRKEKEKQTLGSPTMEFKKLKANFENAGTDEQMRSATLYFEDQFWGELGFNDPPLGVNTYEGHVWNVMVDGKVVKTWQISEKRGLKQEFSI
jgi:hypothetical protein